MGISGHLEIVGAFGGARRCRPYGRSNLRQIALRFFRTSCYVFIYFTTLAFCHGCVLSFLLLEGNIFVRDVWFVRARVVSGHDVRFSRV